jgi:hypothetical protein
MYPPRPYFQHVALGTPGEVPGYVPLAVLLWEMADMVEADEARLEPA